MNNKTKFINDYVDSLECNQLSEGQEALLLTDGNNAFASGEATNIEQCINGSESCIGSTNTEGCINAASCEQSANKTRCEN